MITCMWVTAGGERVWIEEFERGEFLAERWSYRPGEHVTFLAPTDYGKTTLTLQLLEITAHPRLPVINYALKHKDEVMSAASKRLGYKITKDWPPLLTTGRNGWTLWPPFSDDPDLDDERIAKTVYKSLRWAYANAAKRRQRSGLIVNADEMEEIQRLLAQMKPRSRLQMLRGLYRRMRSSGGGLWTGCQAPRWLVTDAYSQAQHLFLGNDPEKRNRDRFAEIGGVDPDLVKNAVIQLPDRHWLYLRRKGRVLCIIGP